MKPNENPFNQSREQALRAGALLDITATAVCADEADPNSNQSDS